MALGHLWEDPAYTVPSMPTALFFPPALLQKTQIKTLLLTQMTPPRAAEQAQLSPTRCSLTQRAAASPAVLPASPLPHIGGRAEPRSPGSAPRAASPRCFTTAQLAVVASCTTEHLRGRWALLRAAAPPGRESNSGRRCCAAQHTGCRVGSPNGTCRLAPLLQLFLGAAADPGFGVISRSALMRIIPAGSVKAPSCPTEPQLQNHSITEL